MVDIVMDDSLPDSGNETVTDDSCSGSVCVEYDSRSSSHEDINEYLQCKDTNMIKATQRQRQMLRDRNSRMPVVQVPDTYFDQIASILNRSLYLCKMEKKEEKLSSTSASSDESLSGNKCKSHSPNNSSATSENDTELPMPLSPAQSQLSLPWPCEGNANTENTLDVTHGETHQESYVNEVQGSIGKDILNNDTLDEIFSFVKRYNEGKNKCVKEHANDNKTVGDGSNCINVRGRKNFKLNNIGNIHVSKQSVTKLKERPFGEAQIGKKSNKYQIANTNCRRKSDSLQSLGKKKQDLKFRGKNEPMYLRTEENTFLWEAKKVTARSKCQIACSNEDVLNKKHNLEEYSIASSDSDQTIKLEEIGSEVVNTGEKVSGSYKRSTNLKGEDGRREASLAMNARAHTNRVLQRNCQANAKAQFASAANTKQKKRTNRGADEIKWEQETAVNKPLESWDVTRKSGVKLFEMIPDVPIKKRKPKNERLATNGCSESVVFKSQTLVKAKSDEKCKGIAVGYLKSNKICNVVEKDVRNRDPPSIKWSIEPRLQTKRCIIKNNRKMKDKKNDGESESENESGSESESEVDGEGEDGLLPALMDRRAAGDESSPARTAPSCSRGLPTGRVLSRKGPTLPRRIFPKGMNALKPPLPPTGKRPFR